MNEDKILTELAKKVMSGVDEWIEFDIDGHNVVTTTIFVKKYVDILPDWVREFLNNKPKVHDFGTHVEVDETGRWEKDFEGETIYQMMMKDPHGRPTVCIETYKRLLEKK